VGRFTKKTLDYTPTRMHKIRIGYGADGLKWLTHGGTPAAPRALVGPDIGQIIRPENERSFRC